LTKSKNTKLKRIINAKHQLQFLSEEETRDYIEFRLYASGIRENIFTIGAIQKIFRLSKGSPHKINTIADYALLSGYITGTRHINETLVEGFTDGFDQMLSEMTNSSLPFDDKQLFFEQEPPEAPCKTPINPASHNVFRFHSQDLRVLKQMARFYIENKNLAEAELYIEKIVQSNEMITDTTMMKGEIHLLRTEFDAAIDTFNQILAKEPMNVHSYYFKALAHIEKGDIDIAKASLGTALSINPKFNKGKSLLQKIRQECQDYQ
jgi:tetratricopeptide (TPR) repeat protein